jgi:methyl-accepting chemotaxis protein
MIKRTVWRVKDGCGLEQKTGGEFREVGSGTKKAVELVDEIAAASNEQSQRTRQINPAIQEMDKTIQHTAANAEQAAPVSRELEGQAQQMEVNVGRLETLLFGKSKNGMGIGDPGAVQPSRRRP